VFFPEKSVNASDRQRLENSLGQLTSPLELGQAYLGLAYIYKHIGPADGRRPFVASAEAAQRAVSYLRQTDDRRALAAALRASVVAFVTDNHAEADQWLAEALAIAESDNDSSAIAWTHHAISTHSLRTGRSAKGKENQAKAISYWKQSAVSSDKAMGHFQEALHEHDELSKAESYLLAGDFYKEARAWKNAATAFHMAAMFGEPIWERPKLRFVLRQAILTAQRSESTHIVKGAKKMLRRSKK
jgi:tetratricopeptide (TPR) repeat protein